MHVFNRQYFCEYKTQYKSLIRKKKRRYVMIKLDKLEQLRHSTLKNKSNANSADSIPLNNFHNYFSNIENEIFQTVNDDIESFCVNNNVNANNENGYNDELEFPITVEEIYQQLNS